VVIPLDQIWALDMPGTRDIQDYDLSLDDPRIAKRPPHKRPNIRVGFQHKLSLKPPGKNAQPGFVLWQKNLTQMLYVARSALSKKRHYVHNSSQQAGKRFSLFFYSHPSAYRVELTKVERRGLVIEVQYRFVPRFSAESSVHCAMIPLGELPAGDYRFEMTQVPMAQKYLDAGFQPVSEEQVSRIVCRPFSFKVWDPPAPDPGLSENAVEIPLEQVWAYQMPGTRPMEVGKKDGTYLSDEGPLLDEIRRVLVVDWREGPKLLKDGMPGFAVLGTGMDALREAHAVLVKKQAPRKSFPEDAKVSLVFFSNQCSRYVHLHRVEREENRVEIRYRFVGHKYGRGGTTGTKHFALIPLDKVAAGNVQVKVTQSPMEQRHEGSVARLFPPEGVRLMVCKSFSFSVDGEEKPGKPVRAVELESKIETGVINESLADKPESIEIPLEQIAGLGRGGLRTLEPELHVYRDTPEKIKKYSTPEGMEEIRRKMAKSLAIPIERSVATLPIGKKVKPRAGFAVLGRDRAALPGVHRVLVQGGAPENSFSLGSEVSIVFFTHPTTPRVRLDRVVQKGNTIEIHYRMIFRGQTSSRSTLVFIPCGKLPAGEYQVKMIRSSRKEKEISTRDWPLVQPGLENQIICQPFSFTVSDKSFEASNAKNQQSSP